MRRRGDEETRRRGDEAVEERKLIVQGLFKGCKV